MEEKQGKVKRGMASCESFEKLYEDHSAMAYWTAYSISHNHDTAMDITQTVFLQALRNWEILSTMQQAQAKSWVWRTARNAGLDVLRKNHREVITDLPPDGPDFNPEQAPEAAYLEKEQAEIVWKAVEALPAHYREAIELHYFARLSQTEAAQALGVSGGTFRSRLARGKKLLGRQLRKGGMLDE